jgi:hypothetical protein
MITLIGSHGVTDIEAFEAALKASRESGESAGILQKMGVVKTHSYRQVDGSGVVVIHKFNDLETAQNYKILMETAETQARLEQMGSILPASFWIVEEM